MGPKIEKSEKELMYERFLKAYAEAYPDIQRQSQFKNAQKLWGEVKNDPEKHDEMIRDFKKKAKEKEGKQLGKWANWFKKSAAKTTAPTTAETVTAPSVAAATTSTAPTASTSATTTTSTAGTSTAPGAFTKQSQFDHF